MPIFNCTFILSPNLIKSAAYRCLKRTKTNVVILSAVRTPIGSFGGVLSSKKATELGAVAIASALSKSNLKASDIDEVIMGVVNTNGMKQSPARISSINAGLPVSTDCTTINKACASSLKAVTLGTEAIMTGNQKIIVAGGMESMSNVPFLISRSEPTYGGSKIEDSLLYDTLLCAFNGIHMGACSEQVAAKYNISREDQDEYAKGSYMKAAQAWKDGYFDAEVVPIEIIDKKTKKTISVKEDEEYKKFQPEKMTKLKPAFIKDGTITAANASKLNDGASVCIICSSEEARNRNLKPIAEIISFADAASEPAFFGIAPAYAMKKALVKVGLSVKDISLFEINEAFSVVPLACAKELGIDKERLNIHGGAIALGHPVGASGVRILGHLAHSLKPNEYGITGICNGGGGSTAVIIKRL